MVDYYLGQGFFGYFHSAMNFRFAWGVVILETRIFFVGSIMNDIWCISYKIVNERLWLDENFKFFIKNPNGHLSGTSICLELTENTNFMNEPKFETLHRRTILIVVPRIEIVISYFCNFLGHLKWWVRL